MIEALEARRIARAISEVENRHGDYEALLRQAYASARFPRVVGVTGPPGVGKSTLVDLLGLHWINEQRQVAVLAVDPSSPFSGGAILGDRIRQSGQDGERRVFFRSLASRGQVGGLSATTDEIVAVLGHFGFDTVVVETVGAGQADLDICETADCTLVLSVPGLGDAVQAAKAGLMEIGDVFAVNKADLPGAEETARTIERSLATVYMGKGGVNRWTQLQRPPRQMPARLPPGVGALIRRHGDPAIEERTWTPPVLRVSAGTRSGIEALANAITGFLDWISETGRETAKRRERVRAQVLRHLSTILMAPYRAGPSREASPVETWIDEVSLGRASPLDAARALANSGMTGS